MMIHTAVTSFAAEPAFTPGRELTVGSGAAYATIQEAVEAALPGDTVLVHGGVYREAVRFPRGGEPGRPITLRSAPGHIVVLQPGTPLVGTPVQVAGHPTLYRWQSVEPGEGIGLWEASSHLRLARMVSLEQCERRVGSWHFDAASGALTIRSAGGAPAAEQRYVFEADKPAIHIEHPWIVVDGIQAAFGAHGILVSGKNAAHVTLRNCRLFCNRSAGIHLTGNRHLLERNELFRNNQYGIQLRWGVYNTRVIGNLCYHNGPNNGERTDTSLPTDLGIYGAGDYVLFEHNIVDGLHQCAFRNKTGHGSNDRNLFRHNVVRGFFDCSGRSVTDNTILVNGYGSRMGFYAQRVNPRYQGDADAVDPDGERRRKNLFHPAFDPEDPLFADPAWRDFRLQRQSPYAGRGAYPGQAAILYVDPLNGDDDADGNSVAGAFRTLDRAVAALHPGHTLYLLPGDYESPLQLPLGGLDQHEPIRIRAYGRSPDVNLKGGVVLTEVNHIVLEGLTIRGQGVQIAKAGQIVLAGCYLVDTEAGVAISQSQDIRLDHLTFGRNTTAVSVVESAGVALTNSLFAQTATAMATDAADDQHVYTDFNVYGEASFRAGEQILNLDAWKQAVKHDANSSAMVVAIDEQGAPAASSPVRFAAADLTVAGARPPRVAEALEIRHLRTVTSTDAVSLLWQTPGGATESRVTVQPVDGGEAVTTEPVTTFQIMGEYFDNTVRLSGYYTIDRQATLSGLTAGREYEAAVTALTPDRSAAHTRTIRFRLPATLPAPRTWYVSTEGDDSADGATEATAWRSFRQAASTAGPGDKVIVLPGTYREALRPRISGAPGHPIVFESKLTGAAKIDLMQSLSTGIEIANVDHVEVIGFQVINGKFALGDNVQIINARGIRVGYCQMDYPSTASFDKLKLGHGGLVAVDAPGLTVDNNVWLCGYVGVAVSTSPGARIFNNTIIGEGNYGIVVIPGADGEAYEAYNNLFYRVVMGYKTGPQLWMMNANGALRHDYNLYHIPETFKSTMGKLPHTDRLTTLAEWQAATGLDTHSAMGEPVFVDPEHGDFRLAPGSPGLTMADDGGPVGSRIGYAAP